MGISDLVISDERILLRSEFIALERRMNEIEIYFQDGGCEHTHKTKLAELMLNNNIHALMVGDDVAMLSNQSVNRMPTVQLARGMKALKIDLV